jgi:hypothetical protein
MIVESKKPIDIEILEGGREKKEDEMILGKTSRKDLKRHQHLLNLGMPLRDAHFC